MKANIGELLFNEIFDWKAIVFLHIILFPVEAFFIKQYIGLNDNVVLEPVSVFYFYLCREQFFSKKRGEILKL